MHSLRDRGRKDDNGEVSSDPEQRQKGQGQGKAKDNDSHRFHIEKGRVRTGG
jgi:hypothetical protein